MAGAAAVMVSLAGGVRAQDADEILSAARYVATLQQQDLEGHIRKDGRKAPVGLFLRGKNIQFQYYDAGKKAWDIFHMRLNENRYDLFEMRDGKTFRFDEAKLGQAIMGSDLSYEDLAFRFLYGPNGKARYGGENAANYGNPAFDALFRKMESMGNGDERLAIIDEMLEVFYEDGPWLHLYFQPDFYGISNRIEWEPRRDEHVELFEARLRQ